MLHKIIIEEFRRRKLITRKTVDVCDDEFVVSPDSLSIPITVPEGTMHLLVPRNFECDTVYECTFRDSGSDSGILYRVTLMGGAK